MKAKEIVRTFLGSCVVYVVVAACSSSTGGFSSTGNVGGTTSMGDGGSHGTEVATAGAGQGSNNGGAEGNAATTNTGGTSSIDTYTSIAATGGSGITDPVPTANADPVNGSRLKSRYRESADGSKEFLPGQWWDSERNEECTFNQAFDGTTRCLPLSSAFGITLTYFSDPSCTQLVAYRSVATTCSTPLQKYAMAVDISCSTVSYRLFTIGATYTGAVYTKPGATCAAAGTTPSTGTEAYLLGAEIPPSSFVLATVKTSN